MKNLLTNWKTTSAGLVMIIGAVVHLVFCIKSGTDSEGVWTASLTAILGGLGLLFAGDASKSVSPDQANATFIRQDGVVPTVPPAPPLPPPNPNVIKPTP